MIVHGFMTSEVVDRLWERLPKRPNEWTRGEAPNYKEFSALLQTSPLVIELPFGYARVERFVYGYKAVVHGAFWSSEAIRNRDVLEDVALRIARICAVKRLEAVIPPGSAGLKRFLKKIGFEWYPLSAVDRIVAGKHERAELWVKHVEA